MIGRVDPPLRAGEAETVLAFLDYHRDTLRRKLDGLDREQLGRTLPPSTMTPSGLGNHLTPLEENRLSRGLDDNPHGHPWSSVPWDDDPDWEWRTGATDGPEALLAAYEDTVARMDRNIAAAIGRDGVDTLSV